MIHFCGICFITAASGLLLPIVAVYSDTLREWVKIGERV